MSRCDVGLHVMDWYVKFSEFHSFRMQSAQGKQQDSGNYQGMSSNRSSGPKSKSPAMQSLTVVLDLVLAAAGRHA